MMMMTTRGTLLSLALVITLASMTQAKAADLTLANNNDDNNNDNNVAAADRVRRQVDFAQQFQQLIAMMMNIFNSRAAHFNPFNPLQNIQVPRFPAYVPVYPPAAPANPAAAAPDSSDASPAESSSNTDEKPQEPPQDPQAMPLQGTDNSQQQVSVRVSSAAMCEPACNTGSECCLRMPGEAVASCRNTRLSGQSCGWNHYTSSHPSTTVALVKTSCPCLIGNGCLSGVCSFF